MKVSAVALLSGLIAFGVNAEMVEIKHAKGTTKLESNPERVVVIGVGALDAAVTLGVEPVAISTVSLFPDYLSQYRNYEFVSAGSLSEPNFETIYTQKPDLIIVGSRAAKQYDELAKIAPTIVFAAEDNKGYWTSTQEQWRNLGKVFEKEDFIEKKIAEIDQEFKAIRDYNQQNSVNALTVMSSGGNITAFGVESRFSSIYRDFGFTQTIENINASSRHGDLVSYEFIREANPETLLIIDKDKLTNKGSSNVEREFENDLIKSTDAYKNNRMAYLDISAWYLAISGIQATEKMIDDVKTSIGK
ncbi:siderophore ABC transporter substrate-binding protein [Vibrio renipiscarius]|uniref:Enterochelin ABC transporter substrate-binding protein n=1 Tax=Vibrio renipiscarius TaxID=1461322 RepID=A0A0C2N6X3_9VIBR|nr:siderophore ABC transporter substrate-binding protein [Vibrio renipiscarius]KII75391.1 enterochelin ABC transporter substrate-binding protein [Vibrio renipiscarius]KII78844.1 enterochelin ABC transporter substrate-binding protein [Vibrio renipiscarius]